MVCHGLGLKLGSGWRSTGPTGACAPVRGWAGPAGGRGLKPLGLGDPLVRGPAAPPPRGAPRRPTAEWRRPPLACTVSRSVHPACRWRASSCVQRGTRGTRSRAGWAAPPPAPRPGRTAAIHDRGDSPRKAAHAVGRLHLRLRRPAVVPTPTYPPAHHLTLAAAPAPAPRPPRPPSPDVPGRQCQHGRLRAAGAGMCAGGAHQGCQARHARCPHVQYHVQFHVPCSDAP